MMNIRVAYSSPYLPFFLFVVLYVLTNMSDTCVEDISTMLSVAQSILEESEHVKDDERNESLKIFTVVTTMFVPLQFLAGVYGMNFDFQGTSPIPWMTDRYGYLYFCVSCVMITVVFYYYLRFKKKWI